MTTRSQSPLAGGSFQWIRADRLSVDDRFERPLSTRKVRKIISDFDPDAIGVLYVSKREDGSIVILDGQHRWQAVVGMGWGDQKVPCHVYEGLEVEDEARLFREYNQLRTKPRPYDLHRAALAEKSDRAIAIEKQLAAHGLEVATGPGLNHVTSVGSLNMLYDQAGEKVLRQTLTVLQRAYGSESSSFSQDIVLAVGVVLARHSDAIDHDRLIRTLHKNWPVPKTLVAKARVVKAELGASSVRVFGVMAGIIVTHYNSRLGPEARISWDQDRHARHFWRSDRTAIPASRSHETVDPLVARRIAAGGMQP